MNSQHFVELRVALPCSVLNLQTCSFRIHFNIPNVFLGFAGGEFPSGFATKTVDAFVHPYVYHIPHPSHPPQIDNPNNMW